MGSFADASLGSQYIILNLGMSYNFGSIDLEAIKFPVIMSVDYVRVYQDPDNVNVGCDPSGYPTQDYINNHLEAYSNPNLTTWASYGMTPPANRLVDTC